MGSIPPPAALDEASLLFLLSGLTLVNCRVLSGFSRCPEQVPAAYPAGVTGRSAAPEAGRTSTLWGPRHEVRLAGPALAASGNFRRESRWELYSAPFSS